MSSDPSSPRPRALLQWPTYVMGQLHRDGVARIDEALADVGLSSRDYYVLVCIDEGDELAQQQVADRLRIDRSDLVKVLDRLESSGLITRVRDAADRRRHVLSLTEAGHAAVASTAEITSTATREVLAGLSESEQRLLQQLLQKALRTP